MVKPSDLPVPCPSCGALRAPGELGYCATCGTPLCPYCRTTRGGYSYCADCAHFEDTAACPDSPPRNSLLYPKEP